MQTQGLFPNSQKKEVGWELHVEIKILVHKCEFKLKVLITHLKAQYVWIAKGKNNLLRRQNNKKHKGNKSSNVRATRV
jgi:hypothetical protein